MEVRGRVLRSTIYFRVYKHVNIDFKIESRSIGSIFIDPEFNIKGLKMTPPPVKFSSESQFFVTPVEARSYSLV